MWWGGEPNTKPAFVEVGAHSYFGGPCCFASYVAGERIVLGKYCSIAPGVSLVVGGNHVIANVSTFPFDNLFLRKGNPTRSYGTTGTTTVGHDVWIGVGAYIGGGAHIAHGAVIGAHAVVAKEIPPYAVAVGNPARVIRYRFTSDQIERLLRLAWWDWPDEKVRENIEWFYRPVAEFLDHFENEYRTCSKEKLSDTGRVSGIQF
jgi:acetyltransferase-like isoleucine patch superfamily enzyme